MTGAAAGCPTGGGCVPVAMIPYGRQRAPLHSACSRSSIHGVLRRSREPSMPQDCNVWNGHVRIATINCRSSALSARRTRPNSIGSVFCIDTHAVVFSPLAISYLWCAGRLIIYIDEPHSSSCVMLLVSHPIIIIIHSVWLSLRCASLFSIALHCFLRCLLSFEHGLPRFPSTNNLGYTTDDVLVNNVDRCTVRATAQRAWVPLRCT